MSSHLTIKVCGLNSVDDTSLKSMLKLAANLLHNDWKITEQDGADLYIYSLDTDDGKSAWNQHNTGLSAILTNQDKLDESADIILKKPLRTKNFSDALNAIADKRQFLEQASQVAKIKLDSHSAQTATDNKQRPKKTSFLSSLSSSISKRLTTKKIPAHDLPSLNFQLPEQSVTPPNTITDPELLEQWLSQLPDNDNDKIISAILGNLTPLNRAQIPVNTRLTLLDIYRRPISKLVFDRDMNTIKREMSSPAEFLKAVNALSLLLSELATGYKTIINESYLNGLRPSSNDIFLIAINRAAELISLSILYAYRYYRSAPVDALKDLNQLYIYCEANKTLHKIVSTKNSATHHSFHHFYCQILLTGIADPYSLEKYDVFRLYKLMENMADKVEISPITSKQIEATRDFLMTACFCIDCAEGHIPVALSKTPVEKRALPQIRLLHTQTVLQDIEHILQNANATSAKSAYNLDNQLLKKIIPQLDASYERKYLRLPSVQNRQISLADGVSAIHNCLSNENIEEAYHWIVRNQGSGGMMVSCTNMTMPSLNIGGFMGIFEQNMQTSLATVRWLHIENNDTIHIGLEIHQGHPTAVTFTPDGSTEIFQGLLLPEIEDIKQPATLIVDKGIYSANRVLRIKQEQEIYTISADTLIENTLNYEQFSFKIKSGS